MFKRLFKKHSKLLIIYSVFFITICLLSIIKVNYDVVVPAGTDNVGSVIEIDGKSNEGIDINIVSVYSYSNISLLDYLLGMVNKHDTVSKSNQYIVNDTDLAIFSGEIQKEVSINNALIAGYKAAGCEIEYSDVTKNGYVIHTMATYAPSELKLKDQILAVNGISVSKENNLSALIRKMVNFSYNRVDEKVYIDKDGLDEYKTVFTVKRKGNSDLMEISVIPYAYTYVYNENNESYKYPLFGLSVYEYNLISSSNPKYEKKYTSSIGPSGGLMQSFYVYELLTGGKLSKGLKIVGTGTVDEFGNAGAIGGIYQKVIAANLNKADIFFVPVSSMDYDVYSKEENYLEAYESYQALGKTKMKLVVVSSLNDIINYLTDLREDN